MVNLSLVDDDSLNVFIERLNCSRSSHELHDLLADLENTDWSNVEPWLLKGLILKRFPASDKRDEQILHAYTNAYSIDPLRYDIPYNIANTLKSHDPISAINFYHTSLRLNPFFDCCWKNLALCICSPIILFMLLMHRNPLCSFLQMM